MAHELDFSTGKAAIAFTGKTPWHGLGQQMQEDQSIEEWAIAAGLNFHVEKTPVLFESDINFETFDGKYVLYRTDDTRKALSVVSDRYNVVQPYEVLDFFAELSDIGGFKLEVAGALSDGKRIWALAKVGEGAPIIGQDVVRPYVLFATSYDLSLATVAKFTAIRVVCNNTITMAVGCSKYEKDNTDGIVKSLVSIPHFKKIDPKNIREQLGIVENVYERWTLQTRILAEKALSQAKAEEFTKELLIDTVPQIDVENTRSYKRILELFDGRGLIGSNLDGGQNCWRMVNAVTQFIDHENGRNDNAILNNAWFGNGEKIKDTAYKMLLEV